MVQFTELNIRYSLCKFLLHFLLGHSVSNLVQAEEAVCRGASFITHLFNAMLPFHHRDPGIVGALTSLVTPKPVFYGLISDGIHTHPTAIRIAKRSHPKGMKIQFQVKVQLKTLRSVGHH